MVRLCIAGCNPQRAEVNGNMHIAIMKGVKRFIYAAIEDALKKHLGVRPAPLVRNCASVFCTFFVSQFSSFVV